MKKELYILVFAVLAIVFISFGRAQTNTGTIKLGLALGLTGDAQAWGEAELAAAQLTVNELNGRGGIDERKFELVIEDTHSNNAQTLSAVKKLVDIDQVDFIIGPTWADSYHSANPLSDELNLLMIMPSTAISSAQADAIHPNIFSTYYQTGHEVAAVLSHLQNKGQKRVVLIFENDYYWQDMKSFYNNLASDYEILIVNEYDVAPQSADVKTILSKLKSSKVDAVIFGFNSEKLYQLALKERKELGIESIPFYTSTLFAEFANTENFNGLVEEVSFITPSDLNTSFTKEYKKKTDSEPSFSASNTYDAIKILARAIDEADSLETDKVREKLKELSFETVTFGQIKFDELNGVSGGKFVMKAVKDGQIMEVK